MLGIAVQDTFAQPRQELWLAERDFEVTPEKTTAIKKLALIIGNQSYGDASLKNSINDAIGMSDALSSLGFEVLAYKDLNQKQMRQVAREFGDRLRQDKNTVGLFYFAGHGMQVEGVNYLIPINTEIEREDEVQSRAFNANDILKKMSSAQNSLNIVILDACRTNPFERSFRSGNEGLAPMNAPKGTLIAYAAKPGTKSKDSDPSGQHGLFTGTLLQYIQKPGYKIEALFKKVRQEIDKVSKGKQTSWEEGGLLNDFCFNGCEAVIDDPTTDPSPNTYHIGDRGPAMGIVFDVDNSGQHGLEAQPQDASGKYTWSQAKAQASSYGPGWHLPTKKELDLLYQNKDVVRGFVINGGNYWSSSELKDLEALEEINSLFQTKDIISVEGNNNEAWLQHFINGALWHLDKDNHFLVRAVRAF